MHIQPLKHIPVAFNGIGIHNIHGIFLSTTAFFLHVCSMLVVANFWPGVDDCQHAQIHHTAYRVHAPLRTESPLLAIRSNTAFSKSVPLHLLSHSSQSSIFQQHRYRSTFLLKRTYITRKRAIRYIYHVPTHRNIEVDPLKRVTTKESIIEQLRNKKVVSDAAQLASKVVRFSTTGGSRQSDRNQGKGTPSLTHLTSSGEAHMVDISHKRETHRSATAVCRLLFSKAETYQSLKLATIKKGDALAVARVAGIQAAKKTAELIPLAHPALSITAVKVDIKPFHANHDALESQSLVVDMEASSHGGVEVTATVECWGKTGVEMEALTAANIATLTMYDMLKGVDKTMCITGSRVVEKRGGKSGSWKWDPQRQTIEKLGHLTGTPIPQDINIPQEVHNSPLPADFVKTTITNLDPNNDSHEPSPTQDTLISTDQDDPTTAQSILESEWTSLTNSFSTSQQNFTFSSSYNPPLHPRGSIPVGRDDLSGDAPTRPDAAGFRKAREQRYEEWRKRM